MITLFSGIGQHQYCRNEQLSIPSSSPSANSNIIDIQSPTLSMELGSKLRPQMKKREQATLSNRDLESFPINLDEEVLGIITLEDVMEELLQVFLKYFVSRDYRLEMQTYILKPTFCFCRRKYLMKRMIMLMFTRSKLLSF